MRGLLAAALLPTLAWAQPAPAQQQSLPPVQQQWQQQGIAPTQSLNAPAVPSRPEQASPEPPAADQGPATFSRPNVWMPATEARIQALDKVDAQSKNLAIKVGQSATFGSLTITVKACVVRPSDQPSDSAAYLDVTDSHPDSGNFAGWMLEKEPSVSMMQNPIYDLRVDGCT